MNHERRSISGFRHKFIYIAKNNIAKSLDLEYDQGEDEGSVTNGRIFRAYLNVKNPIRARLDVNSWKASHTGIYLWSEGYLTDAEWAEIQSFEVDGYDSPAAVRLREIHAEKGYDGIVYPNGFEGDGDSYIAFSDDQIIKTEITNVQNNKNEEAVDVENTSTASSSYSETVKGAGAIKPGFTRDDYSSKITNKTIRALDAIGRKLGVEILIGEPTGT